MTTAQNCLLLTQHFLFLMHSVYCLNYSRPKLSYLSLKHVINRESESQMGRTASDWSRDFMHMIHIKGRCCFFPCWGLQAVFLGGILVMKRKLIELPTLVYLWGSVTQKVFVRFTAFKRKVTHYVFSTQKVIALRTWSHPLVNGGHDASPGRGGDRWKPESLTGANRPVPLQPQCPEGVWRQCVYVLLALGFLCPQPDIQDFHSEDLVLWAAGTQAQTQKIQSSQTQNYKALWHRQDDAVLNMMQYCGGPTVTAADHNILQIPVMLSDLLNIESEDNIV